jgi:excisionase family DNA binding protein
MVQLTTEQLRGLISDAVRDAIANQNAAPVYMTLDQAAELLQVSPRTVRDRVRNEGLPTLRAGTQYRFRREELIAWLEARSTKAGAHVSKHVVGLKRVKP